MRISVLSIMILSVFVTSCSKIPLISPPDPLYRGLTESFGDYDARVLVDRTIIIDPGHGGRFDGAVGKKKTREADVNLGVALELQRMLNNCGANVILTRADDSDLLSLDEDTRADVRKDLRERVKISNEMDADLFISIHHNSTASGSRDYNAIETYYRMGDDGPSLDAAKYIHKHFVRNLGIPDNELVPGNYFVLRNNENPSLLGEASYLSNPKVEKKLGKQEKQLLEARAYLLGIIDYFSRGLPEVDIITPSDGDTVHDAFPVISALLLPGEGGGGVDASTISIKMDGQQQGWTFDESGTLLTVMPSHPLPSGCHTLEIVFRNRMGNSSRRTRTEFVTITRPSAILTSNLPGRISAGSKTPFLLEVNLVDGHGNPVADGTEVSISLPPGVEGQGEAHTYDGAANFYLTATRPGKHSCRISAPGVSSSITLMTHRDVLLPLTVKFIDSAIGVPLEEVIVWVDGEILQVSNRDGYVFSNGLPRGEHRIAAYRNGYRPYKGIINTDERGKNSGLRMFMMEPVLGGMMMEKTVVIDPEGGGEITGPAGPSGTRSIDLNLRIAWNLSDYLEKSGAEVFMTRTGDESVPAHSRVALANTVGADYFISIRHEARDRPEVTPYIAHYGTSTSGKVLAESISAEWSAVMGTPTDVRGEYSYVLRHTPCPAISVMCLDIGTRDREEQVYDAAYGLRESYSIYSGLTAHLLNAAVDSLDTIRGQALLNRFGEFPIVLEIDDWLVIGCDSKGRFVARNFTPGEHQIKLINPEAFRNSWWVNTEQLGDSPVILTP
jgi:N-acetylmuramoyl-L-alanine amidase